MCGNEWRCHRYACGQHLGSSRDAACHGDRDLPFFPLSAGERQREIRMKKSQPVFSPDGGQERRVCGGKGGRGGETLRGKKKRLQLSLPRHQTGGK